MTINRRAFGSAVLLCATAGTTRVLAQAGGDYPRSPVKLIVPFAAGGIVDLMSRLIADKMGADLKQAVIVDNRPGANGALGAAAFVSAPPDGYTLMFATNSLELINPHLYKKLAYNPKQMQPVSIIYDSSIALTIARKANVSNLKELVAYARSKPDGLSYGTWGAGSSAHMFSEIMKNTYGIKMVHVPYKGEIASLTDMARSDLDVSWASPNGAKNFRDQGSTIVLGVSGANRSPGLPDVPTFKEQGLDSLSLGLYGVAYAPVGTPPAIVAKVREAIQNALAQPEVKERFKVMGLIPVGSSPAEMRKVFDHDAPLWQKVIESSGATLD